MEERWGFLASWCAALKGRVTCNDFHTTVDVRENTRTIHVELPMRSEGTSGNMLEEAEFRRQFQKTREALLLLAAVEYVDPKAWIYLLGTHVKVDVGREGEEKFENIAAKFSLDLDYGMHVNQEDPNKVEFDLVQFCGVHQYVHPSPKYLETLQRIAAMDEKLQTNKSGVDVMVPVKVRFGGSDANLVPTHTDLLDVARAERVIKQQWEEFDRSQDAVESGSLRCTFVLEPMCMTFDKPIGIPTAELAETMDWLVLDNVWFSDKLYIVLKEEGAYDPPSGSTARKALGQFMRRVFDNTRRSPINANMNYHVEAEALQLGMIDIEVADFVPDFYIAALFSSIVVSQTTKQITVQFSPYDPRQSQSWYKWLAYGVFSKRARACSALGSLEIVIGSMSPSDVEAFAAIVNSDHPEEELCGTPRGQIAERDATLREAAPIHIELNLDSHVLTYTMSILAVKTFSDDGRSDWVNAIVPGIGRCQVRRGDLTFSKPMTSAGCDTTGLQSLTVEIPRTDTETAGLPRFVELIGSSLRSLTLSGPRDGPDETWILRHCPQLEELTLSGGWIDVLLDFSSYRELCTSLDDLQPTNWHDIGALSTALTSVDNPIARCVRRLKIRLTRQWSGWDQSLRNYELRNFEEDLQPLVQILEANKFVEYFKISVPSEYEAHMATFRKHHLEALPKAREPLSTDSKVAFLSVFSFERGPRGKKAHVSPPRLSMLNQDALANIFTFAAPPVLRQVYFRSRIDPLEYRFD